MSRKQIVEFVVRTNGKLESNKPFVYKNFYGYYSANIEGYLKDKLIKKVGWGKYEIDKLGLEYVSDNKSALKKVRMQKLVTSNSRLVDILSNDRKEIHQLRYENQHLKSLLTEIVEAIGGDEFTLSDMIWQERLFEMQSKLADAFIRHQRVHHVLSLIETKFPKTFKTETVKLKK